MPVNLPQVLALFWLKVVFGAERLGRFQGRLCPSRRKLSFTRSKTFQLFVTKNCIHNSAGACNTRAPSEPVVYSAGYAKEFILKYEFCPPGTGKRLPMV